MSAAEKLKALDNLWRDGFLDEVDGVRLLAALPQIVALVEAAEKAEDILRQHARGGDLIHGRHVLSDALAALDEALA